MEIERRVLDLWTAKEELRDTISDIYLQGINRITEKYVSALKENKVYSKEYLENVGKSIAKNLRNIYNEEDLRQLIFISVREIYDEKARDITEAFLGIEAQGELYFHLPEGSWGRARESAVSIVARNLTRTLLNNFEITGRRVLDEFRQIALEETGIKWATGESLLDMRKRLVSRFSELGKDFIDKRGRKWDIKKYSTMVARTTTREVQCVAVENECLLRGHDLVMVSSHGTTCEICGPLEGKIFSLTGKTPGYPRWEGQIPAHPNCRHVITPYIDINSIGKIDKVLPAWEEYKDFSQEEYEQAINWAERQGLAKFTYPWVSPQGKYSIEVINDVNRTLSEFSSEFPAVVRNFNEGIRDNFSNEYIRFLQRKYEKNLKDTIEDVKNLVDFEEFKRFYVSGERGNWLGQNRIGKTIILNDELVMDYEKAKNLKWFRDQPQGKGLSIVVTHELGHQANVFLDVTNDKRILKQYEYFKELRPETQRAILSNYAATNPSEFVAESLANTITKLKYGGEVDDMSRLVYRIVKERYNTLLGGI